MSNVIVFLGGNPTNNNYSSSGRGGPPTICRACSSVNDGRKHPATWNQESWSYCARTTQRPSSGQQESSWKLIQGKMVSCVSSLSKHPRRHSNVQLPKFVPYRVWQINCNLSRGVAVCSRRDKFVFFSIMYLTNGVYLAIAGARVSQLGDVMSRDHLLEHSTKSFFVLRHATSDYASLQSANSWSTYKTCQGVSVLFNKGLKQLYLRRAAKLYYLTKGCKVYNCCIGPCYLTYCDTDNMYNIQVLQPVHHESLYATCVYLFKLHTAATS